MDNDSRIERWHKETQGKRPGIYGYLDAADGASVWFRRDKSGRARRLPEDQRPGLAGLVTPPGWKPRFPHPAYAYGYRRAVAYEYELITNELFAGPRPWHDDDVALSKDLRVKEGPHGPYQPWVAYCQSIVRLVEAERPALLEALGPVAHRHGLDVVPWGMGWLISNYVETEPVWELPPQPVDERPPRAQRNPAADALLLYVYLTGHLQDPEARAIVRPAIDLDLIVDPVRQVQAIKHALGATRKPGRPSKHSQPDALAVDEVCELLERQVRYMVRRRISR